MHHSLISCAILPSFKIHTGAPDNNDEFINRISDADGVLLGWGMPGDVMRAAANLHVISFAGIGVHKFVDMPQARERGITICNCPGYSNTTVAEHTMALIMDVARHIGRLDREMRNGHWDQSLDGFQLHGKTIGLIGFGGIGQIVARLCKAFGMRVIVWTKNMSRDRAIQHEIEFVSLDSIYAQSDVISLHAAITPETGNLIDASAFKKMKPGALFINTARAELVDEHSLIDALSNGEIAAAGLDVFWEEPLPEKHPLLEMDNVVVSPHVAFNTPEAVDTLMEMAVDNLVRFFAGNPINVVE